jgi:hypothetical protein
MAKPLLRRGLNCLLFLAVAAMVWTAWYAAKRGLTRSWRERVFAEFRLRGIEVTFKKLTVDPLRGFVARDVAVYDATDRKRVLAEIDRLTLNLDWNRLVRRRTFVTALELNDARLSLPLDRRNPAGKRVAVEKLRARLLFPDKQIRLVYAEAQVLGLNLHAEGRLANPGSISAPSTDSPGWLGTAESILGQIEAVNWKGQPPRLRLQFSGDMDAPESVTASLRLEAGETVLRGVALDSVLVAAVWREDALDLQDLALEDRQGRLNAVGRWVPKSGAWEARLESTLDPVQLAAAADHALPADALQFKSRPSIRMHAVGGDNPEAWLRMTAAVEAAGFSWKKEPFEGFTAAASWQRGADSRWSVRQLNLVHSQGRLSGDVLVAPGEVRAKIQSSLPPSLLELALPEVPPTGPWSWLQTREPAHVDLELFGSAPELSACTAWGRLRLGRSSFRGVDVEKLDAPFGLRGGVWTFGPFSLKRAEGVGEGTVTYDAVHNDLFIHKVRLRLNPQETMKLIEPAWLGEVLPYRFKGPAPFITVDGKAAPGTPDRTNINVNVESEGGMDYDFAGKTLTFDQISAKLLFTPRRVRITDLSAKLFNGRLEGNADISPGAETAPHKASLYMTDVDFATLSRLYTGYDDSKGKLNASFLWKGDGDEARKVDGSGELTITDGNVFLIPFLGPFSGILNNLIPGAGYSKAQKATASFTIKNGIFNTRNLRIDGTAFSLLGNGDLHFMDDKMEFYARINAHGLPAVMLFPMSKLFEYSAECRLSNPVWKPRILNRGEKSLPAPATPPVPAPAAEPER